MSSPASSHAHPLPSTGNRLKLHATPNSTSSAARNSIINSSAKGWSPLQINKRADGLTSPRKSPAASPDPTHMLSPGDAASPRRTSSSFKHVTKNSLVSNSPFKSPSTIQGQQAAGIWVDQKETIIHEKRASRALGASPEKAAGAAATPKAAIGLGISATRRPSRSSSGSGSALNGTRRVSTERRVIIPPSSLERKTSASESKENDSPDARGDSGKKSGRPSIGLGRLAKNEYVSKSPFLISRRIPSGERRDSLSGVGPSPKTIPMETDDVFGSPSPRRTSASKRHVSPSPTSRVADASPIPSPPRGLQAATLSAGPSPLSQPIAVPAQTTPTPTPTPARSSMTPSRRLRGPRELSEMSLDSPSKLAKTVTFQTVPDVKEFEPMSTEHSMDGSFEVDESHWSDGNDSLDDVNLQDSIDSLSRLRVTNPDSPTASVGETEDDHTVADESTTANFVDELIAEGLFSPPQISTPAFEEAPSFASVVNDQPPALSTPSLGDHIQVTPLLASMDKIAETDSAGIPYGRTHHAERAAEAHAQPIHPKISQPGIPQQSDSQMLFNGNAAKPSLPYSTPFDVVPIKETQAGPMPDPFITIQTATKVLSPERSRSEDGVPLGRTSHSDRMQAARMLATQSLGLGMPRSPAVSKDLHSVSPNLPTSLPKEVPREQTKPNDKLEEVGRVEEDLEEVLFDVSFDGVRKASNLVDLPKDFKVKDVLPETPKKKWPPMPEQIDIPSPVASPEKPVEEPVLSPKSPDKSRFSLPFIGLTSPFFAQLARVPTAGSVSGSSTDGTDHEEVERPLTPPPVRREPKADSPHRIPSFEFEEISLQAVEQPAFRTARVASPVKASTSNASQISNSTTKSEASMPLNPSTSTSTGSVASPTKTDFGSKPQDNSSESTTTRVRQRISREMIRETINQRLADGSISRRGSTPALTGVSSHYADLAPAPPRPISMAFPPRQAEKSLPLPPIEKSTPMVKANTDAPKSTVEERPSLRPRSQTRSAHELLKATSKDGLISEPKSGLDMLIANPDAIAGPSSAILKSQPISGKVGATKGMEEAIVAQGREKGRMVSGGSIGSTGSRKSRRSMSMSDAPNVKVPAKRGKNSRLTLGIDQDEVSILESFRQEAEQIGADRAYKVKERRVVKASYGPIGHGRSGDVHAGKAWRSLRRPSDMNEHAAQLREIRKKEASNGESSGTIFVKVLGIEGLELPLPDQPTYFCVTLDNSIDYIRTPYSTLGANVPVNQEFSLVETSSFEFSLSLDIRTDPHIISLIHAKRNVTPAPVAPPSLHPPGHAKTGSGLRGLFSSPRKPRRPESIISRAATPVSTPTQSIADYFPKDATAPGGSGVTNSQPGGKIKSITVAKTHVAFRPIAKQCDSKLLEIRYPLFGMAKTSQGDRKPLGKITLQIFRLPPLPGLQQAQLPACIDDALRGIRHHAWWEHEYHEGVLTQSGGDCAHPKRRLFKVIGGNLVAINEVTKKQVASIDLRKCLAVTDLNDDTTSTGVNKRAGSPVSRMTLRMRDEEMGEVRPRSFRLDFGEEGAEEEEIDFWADKQEDKDMWMETLRGLIGRIPTNPLWAELLSQKQREAREKAIMRKMNSSNSLRAQAKAQEAKNRESGIAK